MGERANFNDKSGAHKHHARELYRKQELERRQDKSNSNVGGGKPTKARKGKKQVTRRDFVEGRFPIPAEYTKECPKGFVPGVDEPSKCRKGMRFMDVPIHLFRDHESDLLALVRQHLPPDNHISARRFAARLALQKWLFEKLKERERTERMSRPGGFMNNTHTCRSCRCI